MKTPQIDPIEFQASYPYLQRRQEKKFSYFRSSLAHLITLL